MRLHSIQVTDVGPFGRFRAELGGNLVGVVGPNGAGKSSLLNAVYFALTGDASRLGRRDAAALNPETAEQPSVRLSFHPRDDGDLAVVHRHLPVAGRAGRRRLSHAGRSWESDADVRAKVEAWAGVPFKSLADFVFVGQGRLTDVVDDEPARRAEVLHRLFGLDRAEAVRVACDRHLAGLPGPPDQSVLADLRSRAAQAEAALRAAEGELLGCPEPDRDAVGRDRELITSYQEQAVLSARRSACERAAARCREALAGPEPEAPDPHIVEIAKRAVIAWTDYERYVKDAALARAAADAAARSAVVVPDDPGPAPAPTPELVELRSRAAGLRAIASAGPESDCPVCGGSLGVLGADSRGAAEGLLARLADLEREAAVAVTAHEALVRRHAQAAERAGWAAERLVALEAEATRLSALCDAPDCVPKADAELFLSLAAKAERARADFLAVRRQAERDLARAERDLADAGDPGEPVPPAEHAAACDRVAAAERRSRRHAELAARAAALREARDSAVGALEAADNAASAASGLAAHRALVEEVRDLLRRDAAPAEAARGCLTDLQDDLNRRLGHLGAPFRTTVSDAGTLTAEFRDGTRTKTLPAERLSFGQKTVLALAWRLAVQDRHGGVGLLCLDEPTNGLDSERLSALRSALEAWRPHGSDRQFVIVTHDRRLLGAFDRVVDLGGK